MLVYQKNNLKISFTSQYKTVLTSENSWFTNEEGTFHSRAIRSQYVVWDEEGKPLPRSQRYWKTPYPIVLEHRIDGQIDRWIATEKGGYVPDEQVNS